MTNPLTNLSLERLEIEGFVGVNFDNERDGSDGVVASGAEIETALGRVDVAGRWPVLPGRIRCAISTSRGTRRALISFNFNVLGDIATLVDPAPACWDVILSPEVDRDLSYRFTERLGLILRCYHIDRDRTFEFELSYGKLREAM